jgi:hypothetical protein
MIGDEELFEPSRVTPGELVVEMVQYFEGCTPTVPP